MDSAHVYHFGRKRAHMAHHRANEPFYLASYAKTAPARPRWIIPASMLIQAMALAGDHLYVAGPAGNWQNSRRALAGEEGILLRVHDTSEGKMLAERPLDAMPIFDGLVVARGYLYISTAEGRLVCMGEGAG